MLVIFSSGVELDFKIPKFEFKFRCIPLDCAYFVT